MAESIELFLQKHAAFFDSLADLIPAKFYYDDDQLKTNTRFMKKEARVDAKRTMKQQYKENKKARLDPDNPSPTHSAHPLKKKDDSSNTIKETRVENPSVLQLNLNSQNLSRQDLLDRLHKKIEMARSLREVKETEAKSSDSRQAVAQKAKEWRQKQLQESAKKKELQRNAAKQQPIAEQKKKMENAEKTAKTGTEDALMFGKIEVPEDKRGGAKKLKVNKALLLAEAERKRKAAAEKAAVPEGQATMSREAWSAALKRASGQRVLDDPKLLRRSLKREAKAKQKSAAAWAARHQAAAAATAAKQSKRNENIRSRAQGKIERKKERREKKLLRPGFEGRVSGFLNPLKK